jgi:hypothetical protein
LRLEGTYVFYMDEKTNDRVFLLAQFDHGHVASHVDGISSIFNVFSSQPWWQGQLSETHTFDPAAANQFLIAGNYIHSTNGVTDPSKALAALPVTLNWFSAVQASHSRLSGAWTTYMQSLPGRKRLERGRGQF